MTTLETTPREEESVGDEVTGEVSTRTTEGGFRWVAGVVLRALSLYPTSAPEYMSSHFKVPAEAR